MIRFLAFVVVFITLYAQAECGVTEEQMRQTADTFRNICQPKHKLSDDEVMQIREKKFVDEKPTKCYMSCVMELMGVLKKNKVLHEAAIRQFDTLLPEHLKEYFKVGVTSCKDSANGIKNACDAAFAFVKCFSENNPKFTFA